MNRILSKLDSLVTKFGVWLPDEAFLKLRFRIRMGYSLNLSAPKSYSEKLQWLKLYDHKDLYTALVDKYEVKNYVEKIIGDKYLAKTIGVWDSPDDIDFTALPQRFVLKTTHGGGNDGVFVIKDKNSIDEVDIKRRLFKALKQDLYKHSREWPYKNVRRRIIAEEFLEDTKTGELRDYKFFCFDGVVKALFVATDRQKREEPYFNFFDADYNELDLKQGHPKNPVPPEKPLCFEEMKEMAAKLSKGMPHVRVDLYEANGKVYFGELTFYHFGGMVLFEPNSWDNTFGNWLKLPNK
ncbi:TupA-like ATPgrasp [Xylanibacter ruminicola]|uniref:TupA-like ATPgrasp n=1 Tax=Xylanibacter ruminicola TaxID=839 RepID=A0A1M7FKK4_XYLRU|nr:ATP-grasp fold amidoligase family protein [Xylanibacter ruminicola]SHM04533.1 TupA-like ATPgrasp [Xylanibacter ruminicola]